MWAVCLLPLLVECRLTFVWAWVLTRVIRPLAVRPGLVSVVFVVRVVCDMPESRLCVSLVVVGYKCLWGEWLCGVCVVGVGVA